MQSGKVLTSDRIFLMTYFCWMFAGCILIFPIFMTAMSFDDGIIAFSKQILILVLALAVSYFAIKVGLRNREVVLDGNTLIVRWGRLLPVTLKKMPASDLSNFVITKEARFAMNARGNGHYGYRNMPDRWRLKAQRKGKSVNLGSYATEEEAKQAAREIALAAKPA